MKDSLTFLNEKTKTRNRAKNLTEWLTEQGYSTGKSDRTYRSEMEKISDRYARSLSTSGTRAEKTADDGVKNSGYVAYLDRAVREAREEAETDAKTDLAKRHFQERQGYSTYLAAYEKNQRTLAEKVQSRLVRDKVLNRQYAFEIAQDAGLNEEYAAATASRSVLRTDENLARSALNYAIRNKMTAGETLRYALGIGISESRATEIAKAANEYAKNHRTPYMWMLSLSPEEYEVIVREAKEQTENQEEKEKFYLRYDPFRKIRAKIKQREK